jgi:hypothetical protein
VLGNRSEYRRSVSIRASAILFFTFVLSEPLAAQPIPFEVCVESTTWVRPSPEVQAKIWNDPRYRDFARDAYAWTHNFLLVLDPESASEFGFLSDVSGVWTAKYEAEDKCSSGSRRSGFAWLEVWTLLHRVKEVRREANTYTVTVEPMGRGFQWILFRRMNPSVVLRFVTPDGKELERWDESAPPRPFSNTVPSGSRIRAPNGQLISK